MAEDAPHFGRVGRTTLVADVARALLEMIQRGELKPGDRLPSERLLSQQLGVSRPTVRESVTSLVAMKVLETRHGSGTYVTSLDIVDLLEPIEAALSVFEADHDELFEVRLMLEPRAAALAAARITAAQRCKLIEATDESLKQADNIDRFIQLDIEVHRLIVEASGNMLLQRLMAALSALGAASRDQTARWPDVRLRAAQDHVGIVEAVANRDPEAAHEAMCAHLLRVREATWEVRD